MCGTEPLRPLLAVPNKFRRASHEVKPWSAHSQQGPPQPGLGKLIPVVVVSIALMVVTSFLYENHKSNLPKESGLAG
jgi:hypothetical protein